MIFAAVLLVPLWVLVLARLASVWRTRRQRALWLSVFVLALARTAAFGPVAAALHAPYAPHLLGVVSAGFILYFISLVAGSGGGRWQLAATVGVLVTLGVLAVACGGDPFTPAVSPAVIWYWVVLEAYVGGALVAATILFWTIARDAPAGLPRLGLRTIATGTFLLSLYAGVRTIVVVTHGFGVPVDFGPIEPAAQRVQTASILVAVAGGFLTATPRARAAAAAYRSLLALRPLWKAMRDAFPEVILFAPRRAVIELAGVDDVHLRIYRRVIEIRDGMLALRDHLPRQVPPAPDPAVTEARGIALALRRRAAGAAPEDQPGTWAAVGPDMADEVAWLSRVSRAYRRTAARASLTDAAPTPRPSGSVR
jgi:hypothetical protein